MIDKLEVIEIGDEQGIELPQWVMERLGVRAGDMLLMSEVAGGIELTSAKPSRAGSIDE
jgi:hypothetical protein